MYYKKLDEIIDAGEHNRYKEREVSLILSTNEKISVPAKVFINYVKFKEALFAATGMVCSSLSEDDNTAKEMQLEHERNVKDLYDKEIITLSHPI